MQHHAGVAGHHCGAEHTVQAVDQRCGVAFGVDDGDVNGVSRKAAVGRELVPRQCTRRVHQGAALVRMRLGDQALHRHIHEARVAQMAVTVVIGHLLGLHQQVRMVGTEVIAFVQFEGLDEVEHFQHGEALGRCRCFVEREVAVAALEWLAPARALCGQVGQGEEAAFFHGEARQFGGDRAFVEAGAAVFGNRAQRARETGVGEFRSGTRDLAARHEDRHAFGMRLEIGFGVFDPAGQALGDRKAVARIADGGLQVARQRQAAVSGMCFGPARHRARRGECGRQDAAKRHLGVTAAGKPVGAGASRRAAAAVEIAHSTGLGVMDQPEGVAADSAHVRVEHRERGACGDGGIDGRAAGAQYLNPGLRGQGVRAGDHAVRAHGDGAAGGDMHVAGFLLV